MSQAYREYLSRLFLPGELVCATDNVFGVKCVPVDELKSQAAPPAQFIALNPLNGNRTDDRVTQHRNLLIEQDCGTLDEQFKRLEELRVPYTTLVFSGSKSLHAVIALTEDIGRREYAECFKMLKWLLPELDPTARNPSRLTRAAGAIRAVNSDVVEQELLEARKRVSPVRFARWLNLHSERILQAKAVEDAETAAKAARLSAIQAGGKAPVDVDTLHFLKTGQTHARSRHARLVSAAFELAECGYEYNEVLSSIQTAADLCGVTSDPKRADEAVTVTDYVFGHLNHK